MVTICLECGDVGFDNAYVYCVKCLKLAVHRYCLPEIPKTFDEYVPWVCDDCEAVSPGSARQEALFDTQDDICTERIIFTSTSGSNKKSISHLSPGEDENYGQTEVMIQSVHENLSLSGDARLADDRCVSRVEPNANNDWSRKENVPTEHEHQRDTSRQLDDVEGVKVAADESLQNLNLGRNTEVMMQSAHENLSLCGDARLADDRCLSRVEPNANNDWSRKENVPTKHEHQRDTSRQLDGVEEFNVTADELLQNLNLRRNTEVMMQSVHENLSLSGDARLADDRCLSRVEPNANNDWFRKENVPTEYEHQRDTSRQIDGVEEVKVAADESLQNLNLHRDTSRQLDGVEEVKGATDESLQNLNLRRNTEVSSSLCVKEQQILPTTSDQKRFDGESQNDTSRHHGEEMADKLSKRTKFRKNSDISSPVPEKEKHRQTASNHFPIAYQKTFGDDAPSKFSPLRNESESSNSPRIHGLEATKVKDNQMRWSSSPNQFQSRQPRRFRDHSSRYPPLRNEPKKHRSSSLVNIAEQRYSGHSLKKTHEERRPMDNTVRERQKEHVKEESLIIPSRSNVNEDVSQQTRKGRRHMHNTVGEKDKKLLVIPTRSNVNEEVSLQTHEARRPMHNTPSIDGPSGYSLQVQPVVDPIWRGRFDIVNKKNVKFEGFVAHLSSRACQPVIEEARLLPVLLQLEMVPISAVWPLSFQTRKPSDDSIALYIFPADTRYEKVFDRLVNDMSKDELALRAITKNAELLIFSSTELETKYWRFQNKYFIWGVFKGERSRSDILENHVNANRGQHVNHAARY